MTVEILLSGAMLLLEHYEKLGIDPKTKTLLFSDRS